MKVFSKLNIFIGVLIIFSLLSCFCQPMYEALTNKDSSTTQESMIAETQAKKKVRQSSKQPASGMYSGLTNNADNIPKSLTFDQLDDQILYDDYASQNIINNHDLKYANEFNNKNKDKTGEVSTSSYKDFMKSANNMKQFSKNDIPHGDEDLYILKSQIVPPVCPACPSFSDMSSSEKGKKCQPCPPCARCPEPAFECKKVPNYSSSNNSYLPVPVLNDFSQFGK